MIGSVYDRRRAILIRRGGKEQKVHVEGVFDSEQAVVQIKVVLYLFPQRTDVFPLDIIQRPLQVNAGDRVIVRLSGFFLFHFAGIEQAAIFWNLFRVKPDVHRKAFREIDFFTFCPDEGAVFIKAGFPVGIFHNLITDRVGRERCLCDVFSEHIGSDRAVQIQFLFHRPAECFHLRVSVHHVVQSIEKGIGI